MGKGRKHHRKQFTFYENFYGAISDMSVQTKGKLLSALCEYALYGTEPPKFNSQLDMYMVLNLPTLRTSRRKSAAGKKGAAVTNELRWGTETDGSQDQPFE